MECCQLYQVHFELVDLIGLQLVWNSHFLSICRILFHQHASLYLGITMGMGPSCRLMRYLPESYHVRPYDEREITSRIARISIGDSLLLCP